VVTASLPIREPEPIQQRNSVASLFHRDRRRVTLVPGGPLLIEGPVELVTDDGQAVTSDRFMVALCVCRRSRRYPFCDTSHRRRVRQNPADGPEDANRGISPVLSAPAAGDAATSCHFSKH
jgi:CDGSH-type Zn-finger protein